MKTPKKHANRFYRILKERPNKSWKAKDGEHGRTHFVFTGEIYSDGFGPVHERIEHLQHEGGCYAAEKVG